MRDRDDYRIFVADPGMRGRWHPVNTIEPPHVVLADGATVHINDLRAYLIAYPKGSVLEIQPQGCQLPLPPGIFFLQSHVVGEPEHCELRLEDLRAGERYMRVEFKRSTKPPYAPWEYATTLTNVSDQPIRVVKFGAYTKQGDRYILNTITKRHFSDEEFTEWYDVPDNWIKPGQSVTDPNNYGNPPMVWAYHCITEDGTTFLAGGYKSRVARLFREAV